MINIPIQRLSQNPSLPLPTYATLGSAGCDLCADIEQTIFLKPGMRTLVPTGYAIALPDGYEAQIRPRSGLALHHGITVLNSPGTIDADYRGLISVILINHGADIFEITSCMRIAQMVIAPIIQVTFNSVQTLPKTTRATSGFGSTGTGILP